jgi:hypothetical protein
LQAAEVSGRLYFGADTPGGCFVRSFDLPGLDGAAEQATESCRFDVSPDGAIVTGRSCPGGSVDVYFRDGRSTNHRGCAPAWRPNGELTFVRAGDVVTPRGTLVRNVARFARNALGAGSRLSVQQIAWLTDTRLAVRVATRAVPSSVVVVIDGHRLVSEPVFADPEAAIEISHATEEILVTFSGGGVQVFDPSGGFVSASRFPFGNIAAVAYSPDGRFVALARPGNLCLYQVIDPPPREWFPVACLPMQALDLAWG